MNRQIWQIKLAARIHDPAEKALVLLRDPTGHEGGTVAALRTEFKLDEADPEVVKRADHWASAADRPQFPIAPDNRYAPWAQVRFAEDGELVHPLTGEHFKLLKLGLEIHHEHVKAASLDYFRDLVVKSGEALDYYKSLLAFWRFGPELGKELEGIGALWELLPADTRIPDHAIWQHLDLSSALAGAMVDDPKGQPALLVVSIGPVQEFIAAGRSTSDLWAGSHFLSMLAWQAIKPIAETFGPDAILFPQLRGVPVVDLWLIEQGLSRERFKDCEWFDQTTDYNPLFGAALPNKFVALVPETKAEWLASEITRRVRDWVLDEARRMLDTLLKEIDVTPGGQHCYTQLAEQLKNFPEVHWSAVPWMKATELEAVLRDFHPENGQPPGFFGLNAWGILQKSIEPEQGWKFYEPNDGILYPAVHDAAERCLAAAKSLRAFDQLKQQGYRDSLSGEHEWLTLQEGQLSEGSPRRRKDTLWALVAERKPSWAKKGEHLSAFGLIKRLWPTRYVEWLREQGLEADARRFVISTHVMALAPSLEKLLKYGPRNEESFRAIAAQTEDLDRAALPRRLMRKEYRCKEWWHVAARLPTLIDEVREKADAEQEERQIEQIEKTVTEAIGVAPEKYYALILMDGDRMGAWLSGDVEAARLPYREFFHATVQAKLDEFACRNEALGKYLKENRAVSPARHMAISAALNSFSLDLARHLIEDLSLGKLLYSGGDDVMAMVAVRDLLKALCLLRLAYSGGLEGDPEEAHGAFLDEGERKDIEFRRGFVCYKGRLYRTMGMKATASAGAVIAHHMAPLSRVLAELRGAEKAAKDAGRDAFTLKILKRSGGALTLTLPWQGVLPPITALEQLRQEFKKADSSRRAAYLAGEWIKHLPLRANDTIDFVLQILGSNLRYQFDRQKLNPDVAGRAVGAVMHALSVLKAKTPARAEDERGQTDDKPHPAAALLENLLLCAEFLAREVRGDEAAENKPNEKEEAA